MNLCVLAYRSHFFKVMSLLFDSTSKEILLPEQARLIKFTYLFMYKIHDGKYKHFMYKHYSFYHLCILSPFIHLLGKLNNVKSMLDENGVRARS